MKHEIFIETILVEEHFAIPLLYQHYQRFCSTVAYKRIGIFEFKLKIHRAVQTYLRSQGSSAGQKFRVRLLYTKQGKVLSCECTAFNRRPFKHIACIEVPSARYPYKSVKRRLFESIQKEHPHFDEIIILKRGYVSDGCKTNIYVYNPSKEHRPRYYTPTHYLLPGCMRAKLISENTLISRSIHWEDLASNTMIGFINALSPLGTLGEFEKTRIELLPYRNYCIE